MVIYLNRRYFRERPVSYTHLLDATKNKAGKLLNIDLSKVNNNNGILVDVDPTIPEGVAPDPQGGDDFVDENVNVIVRVEVEPWTAVNVFPILD